MSPQVIAASLSFLTLIVTSAAQYLSRRATRHDLEEQRKQLDRTLAEQRTRTLNERFATAAGQLGSDKPPAVRLAGVYAMAGLADDWPENRQTCVDVMCAYLRMPYEADPDDEAPGPERLAFRASREVRHTVIRVVTAHLGDDAAVSSRVRRCSETRTGLKSPMRPTAPASMCSPAAAPPYNRQDQAAPSPHSNVSSGNNCPAPASNHVPAGPPLSPLTPDALSSCTI
jgi:hypothetical protein